MCYAQDTLPTSVYVWELPCWTAAVGTCIVVPLPALPIFVPLPLMMAINKDDAVTFV